MHRDHRSPTRDWAKTRKAGQRGLSRTPARQASTRRSISDCESMNQLSTESVEYDPFAQTAVERVCATSEAQREVWLADRLSEQASLAFNESVELRLRGELDAIALHAALRNLVRRHEALRATVGPDGTELSIAAK